ncbi:MAG TPA: DbpA RNA binding domain-containing protein, partial [Sphingomonas sp.]|nr:DbpA RNA binding domain-containing protein [Sphingomonas sp.]
RAHRAALPEPEELIDGTPEARRAAQAERHRPGFDDVVWFRMDIGRRQNADPRWLLPLLCRRGHVTKAEIGAIRIAANETWFQVPRAIMSKFAAAVARTANADREDESGIRIEQADGPPAASPRQHARPDVRQRRGPNAGRPRQADTGKPRRKGPRPR